ncbi:hypothetical protein Tco_1125050 [Tanacetum coccineum]|uniref:Uncharacterized protein n=1 Tax=Tanacetum coccineum TaxID=301880 RepID=A0ABQ5J9B3_9ASTR
MLDDQDGITSIPNSEIFEQLALMGYHTDSDKLTFQKGAFSPQFEFLIHNILHFLSPKIQQGSRSKLESQIKTGKTRRKARIVHSDDEDIEDDSSKQGRKLSDAEVQEKASTETEPFIQEVTPTEVIQDQENSEKGSAEVIGRTVTYRRRSEEQRTRKDKGKAIMIELSPRKSLRRSLNKKGLSFAEAIKLEEQMKEEQRAQIARWMNENCYTCSKREAQRTLPGKEKYDQILEESGKLQDYEKMKSPEKIEEEDVDTQEEMKEVVKESGAKKKESLPRKRRTVKRQKLEEDAEKEELKGFLDNIQEKESCRRC